MTTQADEPPRPIASVIASPALGWVARVALASPFLLSGLWKLADFPGAVIEARGLTGFEPAAVVAALVIVVQLGGTALFLTRRWCWLGAGLLGGFTAASTLIAHPFWAAVGSERVRQASTFFEHIAIIGGFAAVTILVNRRPTP
jgi:transmembrane protein